MRRRWGKRARRVIHLPCMVRIQAGFSKRFNSRLSNPNKVVYIWAQLGVRAALQPRQPPSKLNFVYIDTCVLTSFPSLPAAQRRFVCGAPAIPETDVPWAKLHVRGRASRALRWWAWLLVPRPLQEAEAASPLGQFSSWAQGLRQPRPPPPPLPHSCAWLAPAPEAPRGGGGAPPAPAQPAARAPLNPWGAKSKPPRAAG